MEKMWLLDQQFDPDSLASNLSDPSSPGKYLSLTWLERYFDEATIKKIWETDAKRAIAFWKDILSFPYAETFEEASLKAAVNGIDIDKIIAKHVGVFGDDVNVFKLVSRIYEVHFPKFSKTVK